MIDKSGYAQVVMDCTLTATHPEDENGTFLIVTDPYTLERAFKTLGFGRGLEQQLQWYFSEIPYPVTWEDIEMVECALDTQRQIDAGQLTFLDWEWTLPVSPETAQEVLKWRDFGDGSIEDTNYWLFDAVTDEELEWGYGDEWGTCGNCNKALRTHPDGYGWTPEYYEFQDGDRLCPDCADPEEIIEDIQERYWNDEAIPLPWFVDLDDTWTRLEGQSAAGILDHQVRNPAANDNPMKQVEKIREHIARVQIVFRSHPEQFQVRWDIYIRSLDEYDNPVAIARELAERLEV